MQKNDRLSALIANFGLTVAPKPLSCANLVVLNAPETGLPCKVLFSTQELVLTTMVKACQVGFSAKADWGGSENPLLSALPPFVELTIDEDRDLQVLAQLLQAESSAQRCGSDAVLNRLGEILLVRLLRLQLEAGRTSTGLLGGLADPRLSRAIVALHEEPGRNWTIEDLADLAGLSVSRFSELFGEIVGETPIAYLRRWRMILARQDIERGDRIKIVARRYGYRSSEALSRSIRRMFGKTPIGLRHQARMSMNSHH